MRAARIKADGTGYYHCMSRIIERRHILRDREKEKLRIIMRKLEKFCCLEILTYSIMTNHFHILLKVPERRVVSDKELLYRLGSHYDKIVVEQVAAQLTAFREQGLDICAERLKERYTYRMFDVSEFVKTLKQKFSQYYNRREGRSGPLWEQRFKSILVENSEHALSTIAAYIDLNAARVGLVSDPKDYRYCGYGEAIGGSKSARAGLRLIMPTLARKASWAESLAAYREHLYLEGAENGLTPDGKLLRSGFSETEVQQVLDQGGKLPVHVALYCRVRYFSDGLVLGSRDFVEQIFAKHRDQLSRKRTSGARSMKYSNWGDLCTLRALRLSPVSIP